MHGQLVVSERIGDPSVDVLERAQRARGVID
jgi:hypothetical protein